MTKSSEIWSLIFLISICIFTCQKENQEKYFQGLVGAYYGEADLTRIKEAEVLHSLKNEWNEETGHGNEWSGKYEGFLFAPITGDVTIFLETNKHVIIEVVQDKKIEAKGENALSSTSVKMTKEEKYPIVISYMHAGGGTGYFNVKWSWEGQAKIIIPKQSFAYTKETGKRWNLIFEPEPESIDKSQFIIVPTKNVMVFQEKGRFGGWPANNGIWSWDDEILVGLIKGYYLEQELHHSIDNTKPSKSVLARSFDGGEIWHIEDPENYVGDDVKPKKLTDKIDFASPGFAMRVASDRFFFSYDRGKNWQGPFLFPDFGTDNLTSRTDYLVDGSDECLFFFSAKEERAESRLQDRAFVAQTIDGGKTIEFLSWISDEFIKRSVMPSSARISENRLITVMRRRFDQRFENKPRLGKNWIDAYHSFDNGKTWEFLSKVTDTDRGNHNGNPPSLVKLKDGRICVTYGYRSVPYGIRARISTDNGKTWSKEILLRDDARTWDIGYTRSVQRSDGKIITIYYYTTEENKEQHIAATIWNPGELNE